MTRQTATHATVASGGNVTGTQAPSPWRNRIVGSGEEAPGQLVANPRNWRTHPVAQRAALAGALAEVGWVAQVLVNRTTGHLVDGHARVEEAIRRGEPTVPVLYVELTTDEEALVLATLDPIGALATADTAKLRELLTELSVDDAGLARLLAELAGPKVGLSDPDELPDLPAESSVTRGELWRLGDHRLLCGDATNPADVARLLDGATPRLLSTDPPYGVSLDPTWRDAAPYNRLGPSEQPYMVVGRKMRGDGKSGSRTAGHRNVVVSGDTRADWSEAFALVPSLEVGYVWHADVHSIEVALGLIRIGFELVAQIIWDKGQFTMGRSWYHWSHEPAWVIRRPSVPNLFHGSRDQGTIWRAPSPKKIHAGSTEEKFDHPAQKPVVLSETPITNHLAPGEAVYDPFLGSGTTLLAAERLGRRCYGLEIEPRYCALIIERWQRFTGETAERLP
ncbi:MAG: DNA modification methylase [Candidatus Limnocylindrales bacterium]